MITVAIVTLDNNIKHYVELEVEKFNRETEEVISRFKEYLTVQQAIIYKQERFMDLIPNIKKGILQIWGVHIDLVTIREQDPLDPRFINWTYRFLQEKTDNVIVSVSYREEQLQ